MNERKKVFIFFKQSNKLTPLENLIYGESGFLGGGGISTSLFMGSILGGWGLGKWSSGEERGGDESV